MHNVVQCQMCMFLAAILAIEQKPKPETTYYTKILSSLLVPTLEVELHDRVMIIVDYVIELRPRKE